MKKAGNTSEFNEERDRDLHRSFMEVLRESRGVPLREMFGIAARRPSRRFWVSEGRAAIVIGAMMRGVTPARILPQKLEMYREILRRTLAKMAADPSLCMTHAVRETIYESAPQFYLTDESARTIIYRMRQRRRKLAHVSKILRPLPPKNISGHDDNRDDNR